MYIRQKIALTVNFLLIFQNIATLANNAETLVQVNVLFRHGNRTPNGAEELYPKDPYLNESYFPIGLGQLTNVGKRAEFFIGEFLRSRYDAFLGPYYIPEELEAISTDYNRTKMSLELVLASLFPPRQKQTWNWFLNWQPIPYNYLPASQDKVLMGLLCPYYFKIYDEYANSAKVLNKAKKYTEIWDYLTENTGLKINTFQGVYNLSFGLKAEQDYGLKLPQWTKKVWPKIINSLAIEEYYVTTGTTELRQLVAGYLIEEIINNAVKKRGKKMILYSAHESNVAQMLITLGVFDPPVMPNYGSFLIYEIHKINNTYGIKLFYQNYLTDHLQALKLPACETFCELNKFITLMKEYIPDGDLCYKK